jgi:hypothetical protein
MTVAGHAATNQLSESVPFYGDDKTQTSTGSSPSASAKVRILCNIGTAFLVTERLQPFSEGNKRRCQFRQQPWNSPSMPAGI